MILPQHSKITNPKQLRIPIQTLNYFVMENLKEVLLIMNNFDGQLEPKHIIFSVQLFLKLVILVVKLELQLVILVGKLVFFCGKLILKLVIFGGELWLKLMSFDWQAQALDDFNWLEKNLCAQLVNSFESILHFFRGALPDLIIIALFIALCKYCRYRHGSLLLKEKNDRLSELEKRQNQRLKEMRETRKKELENMKLKVRIRAEVGKELSKLEMKCRDMASVLRGLGITVGAGTSHEVRVSYRKALMKFHPDKVLTYDIRQQVEAEEKFKLISRMKDKYLQTL